MGLNVNLLLEDACENELGSDNWQRCRNGRATLQPVLLTGHHYSLQLRKGRGKELGFRRSNKIICPGNL